MIRRLAGAVAALTLVLLIAAPALAGGWAAIEPDTGTAEPPVEGRPFVLGFTVLQHGQTPAGWETPTVHFTDVATGATFAVVATGSGPDGHFVAEATLPTAGAWTWSVSLENLVTDEIQRPITVAAAGAAAPAPAAPAAANNAPVAQTPARDPATDGLALAAVLLLGVLAIAIAGLAVARLAGRSAPRTLSPEPTRTPPGSQPG